MSNRKQTSKRKRLPDTPQTVVLPGTALPLTCARKGVCCHNKAVWLNPWELHVLALAAGSTPKSFRDAHTHGGVRLRMDGPAGWKGLPACCLHDLLSGCRAHAGRPLACRLYPLGRRRTGDRIEYVYEGTAFPCLEGCPEVAALPQLTLEAYLEQQQTAAGLQAQEAYLELMQDLAEGALVLLLDSGLAASGDRLTLPLWKRLGELSPQARAQELPPQWYDRLTLAQTVLPQSATPPNAAGTVNETGATGAIGATGASGGAEGGGSAELSAHVIPLPRDFARMQHQQIQQEAQNTFASRTNAEGLREASGWMMAMALQMAAGLGIDPAALAARWCQTARQNGARG